MQFLPGSTVLAYWILVVTIAPSTEANGNTIPSSPSSKADQTSAPSIKTHIYTLENHRAVTKQPHLSLGPLQILGVLIKPTQKTQLRNDEDDNDVVEKEISSSSRAFEKRVDEDEEDMLESRRNIQENPLTTPLSVTRSYLLLLTGNCTVVRLRQKDFAKYLKLNLAARLSLEYDDVKINQVLLAPPRLIVNVSVLEVAPDGLRENAALYRLAETNATLLELSGEEYRVLRLQPLHPNDIDLKNYIINRPNVGFTQTVFIVFAGIFLAVFITTLTKQIMQRYKDSLQLSWFTIRPLILSSWNHVPRTQLINITDATACNRRQYSNPPTVTYTGPYSVGAIGTQYCQDYESTNNDKSQSPFSIDIETCQTSNPSKLHIFGCRSGSIVGYPA